jgi:hypothetical protein
MLRKHYQYINNSNKQTVKCSGSIQSDNEPHEAANHTASRKVNSTEQTMIFIKYSTFHTQFAAILFNLTYVSF